MTQNRCVTSFGSPKYSASTRPLIHCFHFVFEEETDGGGRRTLEKYDPDLHSKIGSLQRRLVTDSAATAPIIKYADSTHFAAKLFSV